MLFSCVVYFCVQLNEEDCLVYDRKRNSEEILSLNNQRVKFLFDVKNPLKLIRSKGIVKYWCR